MESTPQIRHQSAIVPTLKGPILAIILFEVCAIFIRSFAAMGLEESGLSPLVSNDLSWLLVPVVLGGLMVPILTANWHALKYQFRLGLLTVRLVLISIALGATFRLAYWSWLFSNASFRHLSSPGPEEIAGPVFAFHCPSTLALLLTIVVSVLLTPIVEEIINRGFFLQGLLHRGRWSAIALSSILFGVFHVPHMIGPAIVFGFFVSVQFLNARTLWATTISHATFNAMAILDRTCLQVMWNPAEMVVSVGSLSLTLLVVSLAITAKLANSRYYGVKPGRISHPGYPTR